LQHHLDRRTVGAVAVRSLASTPHLQRDFTDLGADVAGFPRRLREILAADPAEAAFAVSLSRPEGDSARGPGESRPACHQRHLRFAGDAADRAAGVLRGLLDRLADGLRFVDQTLRFARGIGGRA